MVTAFKKHAKEQLEIMEDISAHIAKINSGVTDMIEARKKANKIEDAEEESLCILR